MLILFGISVIADAQTGGVWYNHYSRTQPYTLTDFAVTGNKDILLRNDSIHYKYSAGEWHFIRCTPAELKKIVASGSISQIYFEPAFGQLLNDTMRLNQNIDSVHDGITPLQKKYTGKDVIVGYVDSGLDYNHNDFKNADGSTRVLYYWDHTLAYDPLLTPAKYGYGQLWDSTSINNGTCTSLDNNAHGTTVTGTGSGNGLAIGKHQGAAPESDIIIIETNFNAANWTLTVADAIDFVFSMADTLGKPAVVNTSVGTYLGSHDGLDPATLVIDSLLNDKPGRIVVAAAGNSGNQGKYHVKANVTSDTSFCWLTVNNTSAFGVPAVYFDMWADTAEFNDVWFAFGADNTSPVYDFRGRTQFYNIQTIIDSTLYDSIMVAGNKLAPIEFTTQLMGGLYHIEMLIASPDSATYLYRFETYGDGVYDLWSGAFMGLSTIVSTGLPTVMDFPDIAYYNMPDSLSTTVSSWTCSDQVVTVGNYKNQYDYIDVNGNTYVLTGGPVGQLTVNSSKGPTRTGLTKPDVAASGDGTLSACPLWLQSNLIVSNPAMLGEGGQHVRNGGTSMASPVIAGIAALYLEKCPNSTYEDFINDLHSDAWQDLYTGATPNNAYGYGKVDAFSLLNLSNFNVTINDDSVICSEPLVFETIENNFFEYNWSTGSVSPSIVVSDDDTVFVIVNDEKGCKAYSDTVIVFTGVVPDFPLINILGGGLITAPADSIVWYLNGDPIPNSDSQFINPDTSGNFSVQVFSEDGCSQISDELYIDLSQIEELTANEFVIYPNPFYEEFYLIKNEYTDIAIVISDMMGNVVYRTFTAADENLFFTVSLPQLASGTYQVSLYYNNSFKSVILIKY